MAWSDRRPFVEARALRHDVGLTPNQQADPFALAAYVGAELIRVPIGERAAVEGAFLRRDGHAYVLVNGSKGGRRQRFTVAHEIGHAVLFPPDINAERLDTGIELDHPAKSAIDEREANLFAAELLMPEAGVRELADANPAPEDAAGSVVRTFEVSPGTAAIRLNEVGYLDPGSTKALLATIKDDWQRFWREQEIPQDPRPVERLVLPESFRRRAEALFGAGVISPERYGELVERPLHPAE